jgi:hypothetical protein
MRNGLETHLPELSLWDSVILSMPKLKPIVSHSVFRRRDRPLRCPTSNGVAVSRSHTCRSAVSSSRPTIIVRYPSSFQNPTTMIAQDAIGCTNPRMSCLHTLICAPYRGMNILYNNDCAITMVLSMVLAKTTRGCRNNPGRCKLNSRNPSLKMSRFQ